ncbi:uncharacterized protein LOC144715495 [Wolffia australiana]
MLNLLPSFHGKFSDEPYEFLREFTQFCSSYNFAGVSQESVKLMLFPFALKDRAKEWLNSLGKSFTTWQEVQTGFLHKYFSYGRTQAIRKLIRDFTQGDESFGDAWERFTSLTRKCPHHGIPEHELAQIFYQGLDYNERQLVDLSCGGNFLNTQVSESLKCMEGLVEDWVYRQGSMVDSRMGVMRRGIIDVKGKETDIKLERLEKEMKQSMADMTENFKHLLKDSLESMKSQVNVNKVEMGPSCANCAGKDHTLDACKSVYIEQVNVYGINPNSYNWSGGANGNKPTNMGYHGGYQGQRLNNNQIKGQGHYPQTQFYPNQHIPPSQPYFYPAAPNPQPMGSHHSNNPSYQQLLETLKQFQGREKAWEEEKKMFMSQMEMMRAHQEMMMDNYAQKDVNEKGSAEDLFMKGKMAGLCSEQPSFKLGEIPLYGGGRDCPGLSHQQRGNPSGPSQGGGYKEPSPAQNGKTA